MVIDKFIEEFINKAHYDKAGQLILRVGKDGHHSQFLDLRGWGAIQNLFKNQDTAAIFQDKLGEWVTDLINRELAKSGSDQKAEDFFKRAIEAYNARQGEIVKFRLSKQDTDFFIGIMKDFADQQIIMTDVKVTLLETEKRELNQQLEAWKEADEDKKRLVKEIDVILNGAQAAKQASLCDLVSEIHDLKKKLDNSTTI